MNVVTRIFVGPLRVFADAVAAFLQLVGDVLSYALWSIVAVPSLFFDEILGSNGQEFRDTALTALRAVLAAVCGFASGVVRMPQELMASTMMFIRNAASGRWATSGGEAVALFLQPLLGALMTAVAPVYISLRSIDDIMHRPRRLTAAEAEELAHYFNADELSRLWLHEDRSSLIFNLTGGFVSAQTMNNHIYGRGPFRADAVLRHEITHTLQYADAGGLIGFLSMYVAEAAALSIDGRGDPSLIIRSEAEAYALQHGSAPHYPCIRNCPAEGLASSGSD